MRGEDALEGFLLERVSLGEIPGAAWAVDGGAGRVVAGAAGDAAIEPSKEPARRDTIYDLGSLTKPLVTSFLILKLADELDIGLDDPAARCLPEVDRTDKRGITVRHLLTHTSGLRGWYPLYVRGSTIGEYLNQIRDMDPDAAPGARVEYSCLDYIMLGALIERCAGAPLDRLAHDVIFAPLGLENTGFRPPEEWIPRVAPTEDSCQYERTLAASLAHGYTGFRRGVIRGQVHDQNAWALGGVAGNAGLFSTAEETLAIAAEYLGTTGRGLLDDRALRLAAVDQTAGLNESRSLAFRVALRGETSAGGDLAPESYGHTGFPGTSVWIDPARRRIYVLLTNRVHPRVVEGFDMTPLRRRFHSLASALEA